MRLKGHMQHVCRPYDWCPDCGQRHNRSLSIIGIGFWFLEMLHKVAMDAQIQRPHSELKFTIF